MNGVYSVKFSSIHGSGTGTVFLENGLLRGGDAIVAYWGSYSTNNSILSGNIVTHQHGKGYSVLGNGTELTFEAKKISSGLISGTGQVVGQSFNTRFELQKIASL